MDSGVPQMGLYSQAEVLPVNTGKPLPQPSVFIDYQEPSCESLGRSLGQIPIFPAANICLIKRGIKNDC